MTVRSRRDAGPPRGVVSRAPPDGHMEHRRIGPVAWLEGLVAHFWSVSWRLRSPFVAETLPHPSVHLILERSGGKERAEVAGVPTDRFVRRLEGEGWVFGIKLRPATVSALLAPPIARLTDRVFPMTEVLGPSADALSRGIFAARDVEERVAVAEAFLLPYVGRLLREAARVRDLVERMERDHELRRVEEAAAAAGVHPRTLERSFRQYVGVTPKWVLRRYRLHEAGEQLRAPHPPSVASLAASLGYADQAHFARDFKAVVGRTPRAFLAEAFSGRSEP